MLLARNLYKNRCWTWDVTGYFRVFLVKKPTIPPIRQPISRYPNTRKAWWWSYQTLAIFFVGICTLPTWNLKHPLKNGCFHWMSPNLYMKNNEKWLFHQTSTKNRLFGVPSTFQFESSTCRSKKLDTVFFRDSFLELYDDFGGTKVRIHAMPNKHEEWLNKLFEISPLYRYTHVLLLSSAPHLQKKQHEQIGPFSLSIA